MRVETNECANVEREITAPDDLIQSLHIRFAWRLRILYQGGGTREQAAIVPAESETEYPEPYRFGDMPAYGFFLRHVNGIELNNVEVGYMKDDLRPAFVLTGVTRADFNNVKAQHAEGVPAFILKNVTGFETWHSRGIPDTRIENIKEKSL